MSDARATGGGPTDAAATSVTISVTLEDALYRFVEARAADGGYPDAPAYLHHLVREEQKRQVRERVTALLRAGAATPLRERTEAEWRALRASATDP
jgi:Arc/MetJ-type ribon-helix-helix transcriptional regulator